VTTQELNGSGCQQLHMHAPIWIIPSPEQHQIIDCKNKHKYMCVSTADAELKSMSTSACKPYLCLLRHGPGPRAWNTPLQHCTLHEHCLWCMV